MSPSGAPSTLEPRRIDPFLLPLATTGRFLLLIIAVMATSLFAYDYLYQAFGEGGPSSGPQNRAAAWWMAGGVLALTLVTAVAYLLMPRWIIHRRRLSSLTAEDAPELDEQVRSLARQAGLARPPVVLTDALNPSVSALVFGLPRRRYLRLNGGLVTQFFTDVSAFRATVRHELAHLRNRDVDQTYVAIAVWYAFLLTALVPLAVALLRQPGRDLIGMSYRALALAVVVRLFRNGVLRSREYGADARASQWDGADGALVRVLAASAAPVVVRHRWPFGTHPAVERRQAAIHDPRALFQVGFWDAAGAGLVSTIAFSNVTTLINTIIEQPQPLTIRWVAALLFAPLVTAGVTIGIWRAVLYARIAGLPPPSTLAVGAGLGCGIIIGEPLSLPATITGVWGPGPAPDPLLVVTALSAVVTATVLLAAWARSCALAWLPVVAGRSRRITTIVAVGATAVVLTVLLGYWTLLRDLHPLIPTLTDQARSDYVAVSSVASVGPPWLWLAINHSLVLHVISQDPVLLVVVILWLFPVVGLLRWRPHGASTPAPGDSPRVTRVEVVVVLGLTGGVVYALLLLLYRAVLHASVAGTGRTASDGFLIVLAHWQIIGAITAQVVVAIGVALWVASFRVVWALLAAFLTGVLAVAALLASNVAGGCVESLSVRPGPCAWTLTGDFVSLMTRWVLVEGSLAAVAAGLLGAALAATIQRPSVHRREARLEPFSAARRIVHQPPVNIAGHVVADRKDPR